MSQIKISNLDLEYNFQKVSNFLMTIEEGSSLTLVGDENSGRQTVVEGLLGFAPVTSGSISAGDEEIQDLPPNKRKIVRIGREWGLFPHLTVAQNISFGLNFSKQSKEKAKDITELTLELVGLLGKQNLFPTNLNREERYALALGRAAAIRPNLVILDDPFRDFDAQARATMVSITARLMGALKMTMLFSTSMPGDFMGISETTAVLAGGYLEQIGKTREVYESPRSKMVANLTGEINAVKAQVVMGGDFYMFSSKLGGLNLKTSQHFRAESEVEILIRPEHTRIVPLGKTADARNVFSGKIQQIRYMSGFQYVQIQTEEEDPFLSVQNMEQSFEVNDDIDVILTRDEYPIVTR